MSPEFSGRKDLRSADEMTRAGGERLPPQDNQDNAWLFTCCSCGRRWADPISPVVGCSCGSEQVVGHQFSADEYRSLRFEGKIESTGGR